MATAEEITRHYDDDPDGIEWVGVDPPPSPIEVVGPDPAWPAAQPGRAVAILVSADIEGNWAPRFARFGEALK